MEVRTFLGIELPEEIKFDLLELQQRLQAKIPADIRWIGKNQLHLTLHFLGNISLEKIDQLHSTLNEAVPIQETFHLSLSHMGFFSRFGVPSVIWVGINDESQALHALHQMIRKKLESIGIPIESRKLSPHLTIGRVRSITKVSTETLKDQIGSREMKDKGWEVPEIVFFGSNLSSTGSTYSILGRYKLGRRPVIRKKTSN